MFEDRLQAARARKRGESIRRRLASVPLEALASMGTNLRTAPLVARGIRTALQVLEQGEAGLLAIDGVGSHTAAELVRLARAYGEARKEDLRPATESRSWSISDIDLVRALRAWSIVAPLLGLPDLAGLNQLIQSIATIERATRLINWTFTGGRKRRDYQMHIDGLRRSVSRATEAGVVSKLRHGVDVAAGIALALGTDEQLRQMWPTENSSLLTLLESVVAGSGGPDERRLVSDGLSARLLRPDVASAIEAMQLDTSMLARRLRSYQDVGARFAIVVRRGLLGDDMGLGKTIQALAAIAHVVVAENQLHHVVVCPAALADNWAREAWATTPQLPCYVFREPGRSAAFELWAGGGGILITSFQQVGKLIQRPLPPVGVAIVDECHLVKNRATQQSKAVTELAATAARVLLMSGTMLENRAADLVSLAGLVQPGVGSSLERQFDGGASAGARADEFRTAISGIYLRRTQEAVLDELPPLVATDVPVQVGVPERTAYNTALGSGNLMAARIALTSGGGTESQKIKYLESIADECRAQERKLLVFSYFRASLEAACEILGDQCAEISGGVGQAERQRRIDEFTTSKGFRALALQIEAGGTGLNLQAASVVVILEPQLKPSTEWQAISRARRMGQTERVFVHRLVAQQSADEEIVKLTRFKADLFEKLAHRSDLADSLGDLATATSEVSEHEVMGRERERLRVVA